MTPEQETLIATLAEQNARRNAQFRAFLFALPALAAVPFLLVLARPATFLLAVLALTSLASTAYLLYRLPPDATGIVLFDVWATASPGGQGMDRARGRVRGPGGRDTADDNAAGFASSLPTSALIYGVGRGGSRSSSSIIRGAGTGPRIPHRAIFAAEQHRSPLETWLPYLNIGLGALVLVMGLLVSRDEGPGDEGLADGGWLGRAGLGNLPLVVFLVVLVAKMLMAGVNPERELDYLRYEYKGA